MGKVRIKYRPKTASGRRTGWAKTVTAVHDNANVRGAKAFAGEYLHTSEQDLDVGTLAVEVNPEGSAKNGYESARLLRLCADGSWDVVEDGYNWREEFLSFRDVVSEALKQADPEEKADSFDRLREELEAIDKYCQEVHGAGWRELCGRKCKVRLGGKGDQKLDAKFLGLVQARELGDDGTEMLVEIAGLDVYYRMHPSWLLF